MGCHTWCYKKIDVTEDEVRLQVIDLLKKEIEFSDHMISYCDEIDQELLDAYPEWTVEYGIRYKMVQERQLRMVENGLCSIAVMNRYVYNDSSSPTLYIPGKGMYVSSNELSHDVFRTWGYPEDILYSLEDTWNYINIHPDKVSLHEKTEEWINEFWINYPNGLIKFG